MELFDSIARFWSRNHQAGHTQSGWAVWRYAIVDTAGATSVCDFGAVEPCSHYGRTAVRAGAGGESGVASGSNPQVAGQGVEKCAQMVEVFRQSMNMVEHRFYDAYDAESSIHARAEVGAECGW